MATITDLIGLSEISKKFISYDNSKTGQVRGVVAPNFRKYRSALADFINIQGQADVKVLCLGDSTVAGLGASVAPISYGAWPARLAERINSNFAARRGLGIPPTTLSAVTDSRWVAGSGWTPLAAGFGSAAAYQGAASAAGSLVFTDNTNANRYDVYYRTAPGKGTLTIVATGGSAVNQSQDAAVGIGKVTVSAGGTATTNTVTLTNTSGAVVDVIGIDPYISNVKALRFGNAGVSSSLATDHWNNTAADGPLAAITAYGAHLAIIMLGTNDAIAGKSTASFMTALNAIVAAVRAGGGDVLIVTPLPMRSGIGSTVLAQVEQYRQAIAASGLPYADLTARWISGDSATVDGMTLGTTTPTDYIHGNSRGYADIAQMLTSPLRDI